jgi:3-dehydroquinate dehydratase-2
VTPPVRNRVEVMHGVNLDQLGRRDPSHYGALTLAELEGRISGWARERGLVTRFFQTNHEGLVLNPGAWTHYAWSIRDAQELTGLPAIEVHLSAVDRREEWRRTSVISDLCLATVSGQGPEGYREALDRLTTELTRPT